MLYDIPNPATNHKHFGGSAFALNMWFHPSSIGLNAKTTIYVGLVAVVANLLAAVIVTLICKALKTPDGVDATSPDDYTHDPADSRPEPASVPRQPGQGTLAGDELPEPAPTT
jgi:solute:Na+ symporter, SSS family